MSHTYEIPDDIYAEIAAHAARYGKTADALLAELITEAIERLKQVDSCGTVPAKPYDPVNDPLSPFIGAFDSGENNFGWIEKHDTYFARDYGE